MDERTTRLGYPYTDEELAAMGGQVSYDYDLEDSPRQGESFADWMRRTGREGPGPQSASDAA